MSALFSLTSRDQAFFQAMEELFRTQFPDLIDRFGIWRVHHHFELTSHEVLHETTDLQARTSTLAIIPAEELPKTSVPSTWCLTEDGLNVVTWCCD
ncbi:MAG: hypothetical protein ACOYKZ_04110 [Chlamydiia bacterium]